MNPDIKPSKYRTPLYIGMVERIFEFDLISPSCLDLSLPSSHPPNIPRFNTRALPDKLDDWDEWLQGYKPAAAVRQGQKL